MIESALRAGGRQFEYSEIRKNGLSQWDKPFLGAAGQIRTADLVITKIADAPLTGIRSCYKMPKSIENKGLFLNVYFTMC